MVLSGKESPCSAGASGSIPGSEKTPWRRAWQPTPGFLPGESHGQRSLVGYSPRGHRELDRTEPVPTSLSTSVSFSVPVNFLFVSFFSLFRRVVKCFQIILQELFVDKERDLLPTWHRFCFSFCCLLRHFWLPGMKPSFHGPSDRLFPAQCLRLA